MTELKTLKDIVSGEVRRELKSEAIKWIKDLNKFTSCPTNDFEETELICRKAQIAWIRHFFNITEDDF